MPVLVKLGLAYGRFHGYCLRTDAR